MDGGYAELAQCLGISREKTLIGWFPPITERGPHSRGKAIKTLYEQALTERTRHWVGNFITRLEAKTISEFRKALKFKIKVDSEPICPGDEEALEWGKQLLAICQHEQVIDQFMDFLQHGDLQGWLRTGKLNSRIQLSNQMKFQN